jgi:hypothetical protein
VFAVEQLLEHRPGIGIGPQGCRKFYLKSIAT